nr:MAG TPA: hypothetical protein [Caudoviricetes sp.]
MENSITGAVRQTIVITKSQSMTPRTYFTSLSASTPRPYLLSTMIRLVSAGRDLPSSAQGGHSLRTAFLLPSFPPWYNG